MCNQIPDPLRRKYQVLLAIHTKEKLSPTGVSQYTGIPLPTVYRIIPQLQQEFGITFEQGDDGLYQILNWGVFDKNHLLEFTKPLT